MRTAKDVEMNKTKIKRMLRRMDDDERKLLVAYSVYNQMGYSTVVDEEGLAVSLSKEGRAMGEALIETGDYDDIVQRILDNQEAEAAFNRRNGH